MQYKYILGFAPAALAAVHTVDVGKNGLKFEPQTVQAAVGDQVVFTLYPRHDVAASSFDKPCANANGQFYSGTYANSNNGAQRFVVNVTSTDPVYYYCTVPTHCESGMVGGINLPSSGNTIESYANAAKAVSNPPRPSSVVGGTLLSEAAVSSLASSASGAASVSSAVSSAASSAGASASSALASATSALNSAASSASSAAASATKTGAASHVDMGTSTVFAAIGAVAAWFL